MTMLCFSVYDNASQAFGTPFFDRTASLATRSFTDAVNSKEPGNVLNRHPVDFSLYLLGSFEEATGEFVVDRRKLVDASTLIIPDSPE